SKSICRAWMEGLLGRGWLSLSAGSRAGWLGLTQRSRCASGGSRGGSIRLAANYCSVHQRHLAALLGLRCAQTQAPSLALGRGHPAVVKTIGEVWQKAAQRGPRPDRVRRAGVPVERLLGPGPLGGREGA